MKEVGHTSEFLFGIYWGTWKTIIYKKKLLKWTNKNIRILIFIILYFFREKKKNTLRYHFFTTAYQKSWWYDLQLVRYRVWQQIEIGNYGSLLTLLPHSPLFQKPKETRILKKCKKLPEASSFYTYVLKTTIQWGMVPEIRSETDRFFLPFWPILCIFTPTTQKSKFWFLGCWGKNA